MEHLILKTGRYVPRSGAHGEAADIEARVCSLEDHMSRLTEELEHLLALLDETITHFENVERAAAAAAITAASGASHE